MAAGFYIPLVIALIRLNRSWVDMLLLCLLIFLPSLVANYAYPHTGTIAFGVIHGVMAVLLGLSVIRSTFQQQKPKPESKSEHYENP